MKFLRIPRNKSGLEARFEGVTLEVLKRSCYLCKEKGWTSDIHYRDSESFNYLDGLDCREGYALVCDDCFEKHFNQHPWQWTARGFDMAKQPKKMKSTSGVQGWNHGWNEILS